MDVLGECCPSGLRSTSVIAHPRPTTGGTGGTRRQSGEGSIYRYPHMFRAQVWVTTSTGRRDRKYVTRDEVRQKYLALHQAAHRGPVVSSVPTLAGYLDG